MNEVDDPAELEPPAPANPPQPQTLSVRSFIRDGAKGLIIKGRPRRGLTDMYHRMLTLSLGGLLMLLLSAFLLINALFAGLYLLQPGDVNGARPGVFADAFFFSVQTLGTVGYGVMTPATLYANLLATVETFLNLVFVAMSTGLIFARVSRPTARVMFSRNAVIVPHDGVLTLMFRAANQRDNQILEAEVVVSLAQQVTTMEGQTLRRFQDLKVVRAKSPLFVLSWVIMHPIDEASPLFGVDSVEVMRASNMEVIVAMSGMDDVFNQRIYARHAYLPEEVLWDKRFADVLSVHPDGRRIVDYGLFHEVRDL